MSFLGRLFSHKRTAIQATDWPQILAKIDEGLGALRPAWFGLCVALVEERFSRGANGKIENKTLFGDAELTLRVYQLILACEFIAENEYVPPASGRDFTTKLYNRVCGIDRPLQRDDLFRKLLEQRKANDGMDVWRVTSAISKHISDEKTLLEPALLAQTIPDFTDVIRQVVADAFGDQETVGKLKARVRDRNLGLGVDVGN